MPLTSGTSLGPYKIVAPLGAGGMGEVYRDHDPRLGRDVAIKVLAPQLAATPEVRARFEREARTISQLNHPHICTLHDIGHQDGTDYLVMELLEGETLAHRLEKGPLPVAEVLALGTQIADALDRAHRAGVVHRDLKPGNVMLTKSGARLMDFGLARAALPAAAAPGALTESPTVSRPLTREGTIVGTFQYMAPEQLEGKEADSRSDLWALGCVLYEMATGKRAFEGASQASLIAAILEHEPRPLTELRPLTPPVLDHLVRRCLAKDPAERWQSARDVMHELKWVAAAGSQAGVPMPMLDRRRRASAAQSVAGMVAAALLVVAFFLGAQMTGRRPGLTTFTRLTFQRGIIGNARFAPDGKTVIYSASWNGRPSEIFETRTDLATTRPLGLPGTFLHAVSRTGEVALGRYTSWYNIDRRGPLAIVPVPGSAPRDLLGDVSWADWSPDGRALAVVRLIGGGCRLEMPPGHVLATTSGEFSDVRISPDGRHVAFAEHSVIGDGRGNVAVVDLSGHKTTLTSEFANVIGLAWSPRGREIWFSAAASGTGQSLCAATLGGRIRTVAQFPANVVLEDLAPDGRVLLASRRMQTGIRGRSFADREERELGWLDFPWLRALSVDGKTLLFDDEGETAGPTYSVYSRSMDGSAPVRLAQGAGCALSPDGRWALVIDYGPPHRLLQVPTESGDTLSLPRGRIETYQSANWLPDGRRVLCVAAERGRPPRTWVQEIPSGLPHPVTPEGTRGATISPDGQWVAAAAPDSTLMLYPLQEGEPRPLSKLTYQDQVSQWSTDGRTLFVSRGQVGLDVFGIDAQSGKRHLWKSFQLPDPAGVRMAVFRVTPDGRSYAYGYLRTLDELYLVEGLK
jgi:Tol biopolymer transport system component